MTKRTPSSTGWDYKGHRGDSRDATVSIASLRRAAKGCHFPARTIVTAPLAVIQVAGEPRFRYSLQTGAEDLAVADIGPELARLAGNRGGVILNIGPVSPTGMPAVLKVFSTSWFQSGITRSGRS